MTRQRLCSILLLTLPSQFCSVPAHAQGETTTAIVGQVTHTTNAAVAGALVTVISRATGLKRSVKTNAEGNFVSPQLNPGASSVRVDAQGFEPQERENVIPALGQKQTVNFTLKVTASRQVVQVSGLPPNSSTSLTIPILAFPAWSRPAFPETFRRRPGSGG